MPEPIMKPIEAIIAETKHEIQPYVFKRLEARTPRKAGEKIARTITVTSGKGGVGKTSLVANLAICLAQAGQRVIILDADLGLANIDVVFGIRPKYNLMDVINGDMDIDNIMVSGPYGIQIIAGGSGVMELADLEQDKAERLFNQLRFLEDKTDFLLIDTGAGISKSVISFCQAADQVVVITTTEPTSLVDAFGIIKVLSNKRPDAYVSALVNKADDLEEGTEIYNRLSKVAKEYLNDFEVHYLGCLKQDRNMHIAVRQQTPLMLFSPMSPVAVELRKIVSQSFYELPEQLKKNEEENEGFFKRLAKIFKGGKD
ncbi:MAG: MinD/ParA family protein [Candidatus Riflebacteria bacterium]|jgi:flagellar biosynthesis protein FlhG|nr:MinD/ParA family protein [Candidatus Riflebacteria bacterium]